MRYFCHFHFDHFHTIKNIIRKETKKLPKRIIVYIKFIISSIVYIRIYSPNMTFQTDMYLSF